MASKMTYFSLLVLMTSQCLCVPLKIQGGFSAGVENRVDLALGGSGTIERDGLSLSGDGKGIIGGNWNGRAYGGAYGGFNENFIAAQAEGNAELGGSLQPGLHAAFGYDSKGKFPIAFNPTLSALGNAGVRSNVLATTGDDAKSIAERLGASVGSAPKAFKTK